MKLSLFLLGIGVGAALGFAAAAMVAMSILDVWRLERQEVPA